MDHKLYKSNGKFISKATILTVSDTVKFEIVETFTKSNDVFQGIFPNPVP